VERLKVYMTQLLIWPVKFVCAIVAHLPQPIQNAIGFFIGILWFDILRIRRGVIINNLNIAFPDWVKSRQIKVGRASCINLGMIFVEVCRLPFVSEKDKNKFEIVGLENFKNAQARGRGVCIMTLHMGNGDWGIAGLALNRIKLVVISKEFKIKWLNDLWFSAREKLGTEFIEVRNSSYGILKALKKHDSVVFVLDQFMGPPIGVRTQFFGKETGTAMGLAVIAGRSKAPVVPAFPLRLPDGRTRITFLPEIPFVESANKDDTVSEMTQRYCDVIEQIIRGCPEQWMWVHRRWKRFVDRSGR
jgi:Kdo2-lipid IVA lauroyltransferase/acyltransferase